MSDDVSSYGSTREVEGPYDEEDWAADYEEALDNVATIAGSDLITGPGQLHLLARLKHEGYDADTLHPLGRTIHHLDAGQRSCPGSLARAATTTRLVSPGRRVDLDLRFAAAV